MKKLFLSLVAAIVAVTATYAQSSLVATLSHKGEISVFHGSGSLKQAMEAADHGDIITLASGRYDAVNITKAVTLRGAGMEEDATTGAFGTRIIGSFDINITDETSEHLTIEGIYHESTIVLHGILNNAMFQKSRFGVITFYDSNVQANSLTIIHCRIESSLRLPTVTATLISCVVNNLSNNGGNMEFTNCILHGEVCRTYNSLFTNCLFNVSKTGGWGILNDTNMATYCAAVVSTYDGSVFKNVGKLTNKDIASEADFSALFKSGSYYELTDEAKSEYVGQDGKEMGIYGGNLPYETRILSPQITKCDVAAKTTADGKLSVDIEVKAAE